MCGIAGVVTLNGAAAEPRLAARMRDRILHRGPDGSGEFDAAGVSLAACRLAIVDLDPRGLMPMASADGRYRIVHNGEIYNRLELRAELLRAGVGLRTTTDTEVLLELFAREGPAMLARLDGMFAFAIWDGQRGELFAARDRCGEKPFFHAVHEGRFFFASEPKALFAGGVPCAFDESRWTELLVFRSVAGRQTPFAGVERLLPGHWLRAGRGGVTTERWWGFAIDRDEATGQREAFAGGATGTHLLPLFEESVRRRLIADVPVGTLLSGGLDSSSVTAVAAALSERKLPSFTVRYQGTSSDEGPYAAAAARAAGVEHHEINVGPDELPAAIVDATWHLDEPIAFAAAPELLAVSRYARQHVRVVLTGESADELFGGYTRLRLLRYPRLVRWGGRLIGPLESRLAPGGRLQRSAAAARLDHHSWIALVNGMRHPSAVTRAPLAEWAPFRARLAERAVRDYRAPVRQALAYERETHLPAVLDNCDRLTMAAPLEARLAFTDPRLLAMAARATADELFQGPHGKRPLREAMAGRLPPIVLNRRKQGWAGPYAHYLRRHALLRSWLARVPDHPIVVGAPIGRDGARRVVDRFLDGDERAAQQAWMLGRVVLWHQVSVDGERDDPFSRPFG